MNLGGRLAVVTGGGSGIGQELVRQLAGHGCSVAFCDVRANSLSETTALARQGASAEVSVTGHVCDVADQSAVDSFRDNMIAEHATDHVDILVNNAGMSGGASFVAGRAERWERTFAVCWGGVYNCSRSFLPLLLASERAHLVNISSVNGFWARLGPGLTNSAYSTAKFAVKGFTEGLVEDFRLHAPHVSVTLVMPGHVGTNIVPDEEFRASAPTSAAEAASDILLAIEREHWRVLIGNDARRLDALVRADPEGVYAPTGPNLFDLA